MVATLCVTVWWNGFAVVALMDWQHNGLHMTFPSVVPSLSHCAVWVLQMLFVREESCPAGRNAESSHARAGTGACSVLVAHTGTPKRW
eukprot:4172899-Amphidinium_carterae.2